MLPNNVLKLANSLQFPHTGAVNLASVLMLEFQYSFLIVEKLGLPSPLILGLDNGITSSNF